MSARLPLLLAVGAMTVAGCGTAPRDAVRAKVQEFVSATRKHDYRMLCSDVLAPQLIARVSIVGVSCEEALQIGLASVQNPAISIGQVTVKGSSARVIALSLAQGQQSALNTIDLVRTPHGWRIASLSVPPSR